MSNNRNNTLEKLYLDHRKLVYAFISDYSNEEDVMEEIASTVWMKVWEKEDFFLDMDKKGVKYYLRAMVKTAASDYFRSLEQENKKVEKLKEYLIDSGQLKNAEESRFLENINYYLREAINVLSEDEKLLIIMRFKYNQSMKSIGDYFGITEGNVRIRKLRILTKMKKKINDLMLEGRSENESREK